MLTPTMQSIAKKMGKKAMTLEQIKKAFPQRKPGPLMRAVYAMVDRGVMKRKGAETSPASTYQFCG